MIKKIALAVGSALVVSALFAKKQVNNATNVVNNLTFKVAKINTINFAIGSIDINLDLTLTNNTNIDFSANTGKLLSLQKIDIYTDTGIHVATATKQLYNIFLPAFGSATITDVQAQIPMTNLTSVAISLIRNNPKKLEIKAHVNILGNNYIV